MMSRTTLMGIVAVIGRRSGLRGSERPVHGVAGRVAGGMATLLMVAAQAAVAAEPDAAVEGQMNQRLTHARQGLRSASHAELELVRRTCGSLAKKSRSAIVAAADQGLERAAQALVARQREGRGSHVFDARQHIHDAIVPVLEQLVSAEEFAAYQREHAARITRRARAARLRIIDKVTTELDLSAAQAAVIEADLIERWQPGWLVALSDHHVNANGHGLRPAPDFAAEAITPHLDERQRAVWEDWCRRGAASNLRGTLGWDGRSSQPDPWWQP